MLRTPTTCKNWHVQITESQVAEMEEQGFTIFERLFSASEMDELGSVLVDLEKRRNEEIASAGGEVGISRANEITFNDHLAEADPLVRSFCERQEFVDITTALLGPDVDLYWNQTVFKHPEGEKIFPWHQDDAYMQVDPAPYLTLWLAVNDATLENGCISVLPGSHKGGLRPHVWKPEGWTGHGAEDPDQGIPVPVPAGSVVCFWSLTMHKSASNRSSGMRRAYIIQYCAAGTRYKESGELIPNLIPIARGGVRVGPLAS